MALRPLLIHLADSPDGVRLAREGGRAFVSQSMRAYLVAALLDGVDGAAAAGRPAIVVAGDDRQARDLAADLRAWLHPRPVRFYPSRGVTYESHLAPPPHLVGLRVAALDALLQAGAGDPAAEPPVVVASAVALSEKVPDPALRPSSTTLRVGDLIDLDETAAQLVEMGYERVDQVEDRGQFAVRGDIIDIYPATEERAVRCELFDIEVERLTFFSTFTQRSLEEAERVEIAPAAELAPEQREAAEGQHAAGQSAGGERRAGDRGRPQPPGVALRRERLDHREPARRPRAGDPRDEREGDHDRRQHFTSPPPAPRAVAPPGVSTSRSCRST
jgi:transcription-repair coupling factor (superfamily II helicase)